jgi:2-polyprenyl-3-methyl-5-hydroxy-6-metoxy-1,4-benzoquinol methylase
MTKENPAFENNCLPEGTLLLFNDILIKKPAHENFLRAALDIIISSEKTSLEEYIQYCLSMSLSIDYLTDCYLTMVQDTFNEQVYFMRHKHYRHNSFQQVADNVYFNKEYMDRYMYGLALSSFIWPNHLYLSREFSKMLPNDKRGKYLEIGPGHGYHIMTAMQKSSYDDFVGIDLSEASIQQTQSIIDFYAPSSAGNLILKQADFLSTADLSPQSFDAIVMGEVLEHVERPEVFLSRIAELAKPEAYIFITTCINAPAVDHIYLWRDTDSLESMIEGCGLTIKKALRLPYGKTSLEESKQKSLAINVSYVLEASK